MKVRKQYSKKGSKIRAPTIPRPRGSMVDVVVLFLLLLTHERSIPAFWASHI